MNTKQENIERFNAIAAEWDEDPKRLRMGQEVAQAMLAALAPSGRERALEFGAGTGLVTLPMASKLAHVIAMDSSAGMLAVLRKKCAAANLKHVEIIEGTVPEQLPNESLDLIYSSMTLHHVEDVAGLLQILATHLKPGGHVAFADLDAEDGHFHADDAKGVAHHGFDRKELGGWLRTAGFTEVKFSTASTARKERDDGSVHDYPIFLAVARKSAK